jgi:hypothetical protein
MDEAEINDVAGEELVIDGRHTVHKGKEYG